MKIELNREILVKKLSVVGNVIPQKSTLPILDHALVTIIGDRIIFTASDAEITVSTSMNFDLIEGEAINFVCDTNIVLKTVSTLKTDIIWLEVKEKSIAFGSSGTRKKYEIPLYYTPESFPTIKNEFLEPITVPGELLSQAIKITSPIVNKADLRIGFTGVFIGKVGDNLRFASADSMFAVVEFPIESDFPHILASKETIKFIGEFEKSASIEMAVSTDNTTVMFDDGTITAYCRLIDAKFPNIDAIISQVNTNEFAKVDRLECVSCVSRASLFMNRESKAIKLDYTNDDALIISTENVDYAKRAIENIDFVEKTEGMNFEMGLNSDFLSTCLRSLTGDNLVISQNSFKMPMYVTDDKSRHGKVFFVVAPILLHKDK